MSNSYYIEKMLSLKEAEVTSLEMLVGLSIIGYTGQEKGMQIFFW